PTPQIYTLSLHDALPISYRLYLFYYWGKLWIFRCSDCYFRVLLTTLSSRYFRYEEYGDESFWRLYLFWFYGAYFNSYLSKYRYDDWYHANYRDPSVICQLRRKYDSFNDDWISSSLSSSC